MSSAEMSGERQKLRDSIQRDPEVFSEVYQLLKASVSTGTQLESLNDWSSSDDSAHASVLDELFSALPKPVGSVQLESQTLSGAAGTQLDVLLGDQQAYLSDPIRLEAIVKEIGRPALPVTGNVWQASPIASLQDRLVAARRQLSQCIPAVGRIDGQARMKGSGWLLYDDILITNAHVAQTFVSQGSDKVSFTFDEVVQFDTQDAPTIGSTHQAQVVELLTLRPESLDVAAFKVKWQNRPDFMPLELDETPFDSEWDIAAIGYPADDGRDTSFAQLNYFQRVFEIKRLSPGRLLRFDDAISFQHDCTTLGGSSGSPIINLQSGKVVGLHFAGKTGEANLAIKSQPLQQALKKFRR